MNNPIVRGIVASVAGIVTAGIVVALVETLGHLIYPPPEGLDLTNPDDMAQLMTVIPIGAKIAVVAAWFAGSLAGAIVAGWIGRTKIPGWIVAAFMLLASVVTTQMFPHPVWMIIAAVALPIVAKLLADRMVAHRFTV